MTETVFRRITADDFPSIVALQAENLAASLTEAQRKDGYLSVLWSEDQLAEADENLAVFIAQRKDALAGYMVATQPSYNERIPLVRHLMGLYDSIVYREKPLSAYRSFFYGPACVAASCRGGGILEGLFDAVLKEASGRYDIGVAFIGTDNERSLQAHTRKLGMTDCAGFEFNGKNFRVFAFSVPESGQGRGVQ